MVRLVDTEVQRMANNIADLLRTKGDMDNAMVNLNAALKAMQAQYKQLVEDNAQRSFG